MKRIQDGRSLRSRTAPALRDWRAVLCIAAAALVTGCGGDGGSPATSSPGGSVSTPDAVPAITTAPANQSVQGGADATFSVTATGGDLGYQWQLSVDNGSTFSNVPGATSASYTTAATSSADAGYQYRVLVSNSAGQATSAAATLTVSSSSTPVSDASGCSANIQTGWTYHEVTSLTGGGQRTDDGVVIGPAVFHGQSAIDIQVTSVSSIAGVTVDEVIQAYANYDASTHLVTDYGGLVHSSYTMSGQTTVSDADSQETPPLVDASYTLQPGQSVVQTSTLVTTATNTIDGVAQAPSTTTGTVTDTVTFVGIVSVTVPAGTFQACRFDHSRVSSSDSTPSLSTYWLGVGNGVQLQSATSGVVDSQATSFTVTAAP